MNNKWCFGQRDRFFGVAQAPDGGSSSCNSLFRIHYFDLRQHGLVVIEDACQAHGARYRGWRVGSIGHASTFSFYPSKNLSAYAEGGALTTNDVGTAELVRSPRSHGQSGPYTHERIGYNYRMDGFQGAVLRVKLKRLEQWNARRKEIAALYRSVLKGANVETPLDDP
jgi:dTDP-4-amino-4,6-dideoxygalactose transaminase